jgi:polysaccharide export outer membrane protein
MRSAVVIFLSLTAVVGCATPQAVYDYASELDPRKTGFVLGPSDEVAINVWRNPDLSTRALVRPDGTVTMPLIGDLRAGGRTPSQLRDEIEIRLRNFIKDRSVTITVAVTQVRSYRFTVTGGVATPGLYSVQRYVTVQEAISMAGGPSRFSSGERVVIVRSEGGKARRVPINYKAIISGKSPEQNLVLLSGDVVLVE